MGVTNLPRKTVLLNSIEETLTSTVPTEIDAEDYARLVNETLEIAEALIDDDSPAPYADSDDEGNISLAFRGGPSLVMINVDPEGNIHGFIEHDEHGPVHEGEISTYWRDGDDLHDLRDAIDEMVAKDDDDFFIEAGR